MRLNKIPRSGYSHKVKWTIVKNIHEDKEFLI